MFFGGPVRPNQASLTAEYMALFRALESVRPPASRLFTDPFSREFLRPALRIATEAARIPVVGEAIPWIIDHWWPGARTSGVARTRFIDDVLFQALHDGVQQVVILGAGFDSRAYRLPGMDRVRVIEVDHPDTLKAKRERLQQVLGSTPNRVHFAAVDFNNEQLEDVLTAPAFESICKTFFLWEGVTNYLTAAAVDATFRAMRRVAERSLVLFTYVHKEVLEAPGVFEGTASLNQTLQRAGEHWTFGFDPSELPEYLEHRGFRLLEDIGSTEYRKRYMDPNPRMLLGYEFYRIALAESQPTSQS
jgi:methyltransferase (TIGR00027 family)